MNEPLRLGSWAWHSSDQSSLHDCPELPVVTRLCQNHFYFIENITMLTPQISRHSLHFTSKTNNTYSICKFWLSHSFFSLKIMFFLTDFIYREAPWDCMSPDLRLVLVRSAEHRQCQWHDTPGTSITGSQHSTQYNCTQYTEPLSSLEYILTLSELYTPVLSPSLLCTKYNFSQVQQLILWQALSGLWRLAPPIAFTNASYTEAFHQCRD